LERDVAQARVEQERLRKQTAELEQKNLATASQLEKERALRVEMEMAVSPRIMEQRQSAKELEPFRGTSVTIESLAESEPWRTAGQIAWILDTARWNVLSGMRRYLDATEFFDGVTVETNVGALPPNDRSIQAANALVAVLTKNNIKAHRRPHERQLPPNTLIVRVGLKPTEYFSGNRTDLQYGNMLYK
jgi:hypothetical protein